MATEQIRFDDGAAYERYMGIGSQLAGEAFLDWLDMGRANTVKGAAVGPPDWITQIRIAYKL